MTDQELLLLHYDDYFKKLNIDYMIACSSLLFIIRDGALNSGDREIDLAVLAEDIKPEIYKRFKADGAFTSMYACKHEYCETYLSCPIELAHSGAWIAFNPVYNKNGKNYFNMLSNECLLWYDKDIKDKSKWDSIIYLNREFKAPPDHKEWLRHWYGDNWMTPQAGDWHSNKNRIKYESI